MRIGIIGAGFAGLSTAKVLTQFGHSVRVFEKEADVGGVWSASRRYPGLSTQNVRSTYALSDFPYPPGTPEWPSGEQVQAYLQSYAGHFGLMRDIELNTEVLKAEPIEPAAIDAGEGLRSPGDNGWRLTVRSSDGHTRTERFDWIIVCNGIFSQPMIPEHPGRDDFEAAGGRVFHTSTLTDPELARGRDVVVIGYGKSSCDVAQSLSKVARSMQVVARHMIWKVPKMLMNRLNYKYLLLTRMGEALFRYIELRGIERFLHGPGLPIRNSMLGSVQHVITRQCRLDELGLNPGTPFDTIARSTVSLVTDGFFEGVCEGRIGVSRDSEIVRYEVRDGRPGLRIRSRAAQQQHFLPADLVVYGTGWTQSVPFLPQSVLSQVLDEQGNFRLYRSMVPVGVRRIAFNGYNSSFFSQLNCEIGALWIAEHIAGALRLPADVEQNRSIDRRLAWMEQRTDGKHSKGTNIIPFSVHHLDELLRDLDLQLPLHVRIQQWLLPVDPRDFARATRALHARHRSRGLLATPQAGQTSTTNAFEEAA